MKKDYYLLFPCLLLFLINQGLVLFEVPRPEVISSYLDDLLVMPIILTICLFGTRYVHSDHNLRLSIVSALSVAVLYSFYFEAYLPERSSRYTADWFDVALYFVGALLFYAFQNLDYQTGNSKADSEYPETKKLRAGSFNHS